MAEVFSGPWSIAVTQVSADLPQRFVIAGSNNADRAYPGQVGTSVGVSGDRWTVDLEWLDGNQFRTSEVRRSMAYDLFKGLSAVIAADDLGPLGDHDFNDLVLELHCEDPALDPMRPDHRRVNFTYPRDRWRERPK